MLAVLRVVSGTPASGLAAHHQFHGIHGPPSSGDVPQQPSGFEPRGCAALGDRLHPHAVSNQVQRAPDQLNFFTHPQFATSNPGRGGRRKRPLVFTEHGALMAATVLNSARAVEVSLYVVRAFVRLRQAIAGLMNTIQTLMAPPEPSSRWPIGFVNGS